MWILKCLVDCRPNLTTLTTLRVGRRPPSLKQHPTRVSTFVGDSCRPPSSANRRLVSMNPWKRRIRDGPPTPGGDNHMSSLLCAPSPFCPADRLIYSLDASSIGGIFPRTIGELVVCSPGSLSTLVSVCSAVAY